MPRCKIVMADFCEDADFLRSLRSDFTYLVLPLQVEGLWETVEAIRIQYDQETTQVEREVEAFLDSIF